MREVNLSENTPFVSALPRPAWQVGKQAAKRTGQPGDTVGMSPAHPRRWPVTWLLLLQIP